MKTKSLTEIAFFIVACAVVMGFIYCLGLKRKPLKYKEQPDGHVSWINQADSANTDIGLIDAGNGPYAWDNEEDYGHNEENGYKCLDTDPNFIVYYREDANGKWKKNAEMILREANDAMLDLASFMGGFPAPASFYGRRLPIYLPTSEADYYSTASAICGSPFNSPSSGVYLSAFGLHGVINLGILLNPSTFDEDAHPDYTYHFVLRHEMNHYVFFSNLDYSVPADHKTWEYEGLADFFAYNLGDRKGYVTGEDTISFIKDRCLLDGEFPEASRFSGVSYWAGESFYKFLKDTVGAEKTSRFVRYLYMEPFKLAITRVLSDSTDVHEAWVESLLKVNGYPSGESPDAEPAVASLL